jgi:hypothetical protein
MISTKHHQPNLINGVTPDIIKDYNFGKTGVDQYDQMVKNYEFKYDTRSWSLKTFIRYKNFR